MRLSAPWLLLGGLALTSNLPAAFTLTIGTGDGSLSIDKVYDQGYFDGDTALFDPGAPAAGNTVWNLGFMIRANGTNYWLDDAPQFTTHTTRPTNGIIGTTATTLTNTDMQFSSTPGLLCSLGMVLSQPTPGDTARMVWTYTFNNTSGGTITARMIMFLDADIYIGGTSFNNDRVAIVPNRSGAGTSIAVGNSVADALSLDQGILIQCNRDITASAGLSNSTGPSEYWSNTLAYSGNTPESDGEIVAPYRNTVEEDTAPPDLMNDTTLPTEGNDVGGAVQVDFSMVSGASASVVWTATWGLNETISAGSLPVDLSVFSAQ